MLRPRPPPNAAPARIARFLRRAITLSAAEGPTHPPLVQQTFPEYFATEVLAKHASRPALISRSERPHPHGGPSLHNMLVESHLAWDFEQFDAHIQALARGLLDMGVQKGDRVGVVMGNNSAYGSLQWACASIGAILVTLNPAYRLPELVNTLNLVGAKHLFLVPRLRSSTYVGGDLKTFEEEREIARCAVDFREVLVWREDSPLKARVAETARSLHCDEVMNLQFTSGTTGAPKAVSLTHHNLLNNAISIARNMRLTSSDVLCNPPPLFHCFDTNPTRLVLGNLAAWTHGACIVYPSEIYSPPAIVDALVNERCTALHGVPTHHLGVLHEVQRRRAEGQTVDTSLLRYVRVAHNVSEEHRLNRYVIPFNVSYLCVGLGSRRVHRPVSFQANPDDPIIKRVETVGRPLPHVKAKIVDEHQETVPVGTPGEILVSGYLVHKGYWEDEEQSVKATVRDPDGTVWMCTGDEGIMDEEGYLKVVGRIKVCTLSTKDHGNLHVTGHHHTRRGEPLPRTDRERANGTSRSKRSSRGGSAAFSAGRSRRCVDRPRNHRGPTTFTRGNTRLRRAGHEPA
ncbi:uncharacterized protein B0H18DRAFT_1005361, partial [Fomitopsis serialis]|uniref:uncharacterized protein n=1 Tax=Fomitopsis serialis TaxID=139415 RepID=UPI0020076CF2